MAGTRKLQTVVLAALVAATVVGCDGSTGSTKAGGSTTPLTLRLGTDDGPTAPTRVLIDAFTAQVQELSGGKMRIEPVWSAGKPSVDTRDWDQRVARMVVAGDLEMGLIPARAWDTEGVSSLRALSAPLLLTSHALVSEVVQGDLADAMLAGLAPVGVTGLALVPESLRHVFYYETPLVSPDAFAGTTVRTARSETGYAMFRAWGATPDDLIGDAFDQSVADGSVAGVDSSFARAEGLPGPRPSVAANLTTSANIHTIVVNTSSLKDLTAAQAKTLRTAATQARDAILAEPPDEASLATAFCSLGGRVTLASAADLAALEQAAQPVFTELEREPATKSALAQIARLKATTEPAAPISPCEPVPEAAGSHESVGGLADTSGAFPAGIYRMEVSAQTLVQDGMTEADALNHAGIWTLTFDGGRIEINDLRARDAHETTDRGAYCVTAGRVSIAPGQTDSCAKPLLFSAEWQLIGRELRFTDLVGDPSVPVGFTEALWGSNAWTRID